MARYDKLFKDKTVLITGGAGSIGSELCKELIRYDVRSIRVLDNNETGLFDLAQQVNDIKLRTFIGDVRDKDRTLKALKDVDIVFHVAALKHVPLCEYNAFEAMKTNVVGTQNLLDLSMEQGVEKFVFISTDKACTPFNVMGTTKLLAEKLTISANRYKGEDKGAFYCIRFGNVLGSRGSVIPIFKESIEKDQSITITDKRMTRFIMRTSEAIDLVFQTMDIAQGGEIFILKMPALRLMDLAKVIIEEYAPKSGHRPKDIKVKVSGKRPGEKNHELLLNEDEAEQAFELKDMFVQLPLHFDPDREFKYPTLFKKRPRKAQLKAYSSSRARMLKKEEVRELIKPML